MLTTESPPSPPAPTTEYISEKWDPIIASGLTTTAVATTVGGILGTLVTRRGSGWRTGAMMAGVGFGIGNVAERVWDVKSKE